AAILEPHVETAELRQTADRGQVEKVDRRIPFRERDVLVRPADDLRRRFLAILELLQANEKNTLALVIAIETEARDFEDLHDGGRFADLFAHAPHDFARAMNGRTGLQLHLAQDIALVLVGYETPGHAQEHEPTEHEQRSISR